MACDERSARSVTSPPELFRGLFPATFWAFPTELSQPQDTGCIYGFRSFKNGRDTVGIQLQYLLIAKS